MQNRLIWMSFTGLPYIVNTFVSTMFRRVRSRTLTL
jgi:hypothetical protein